MISQTTKKQKDKTCTLIRLACSLIPQNIVVIADY
jgi:hypothetical protein